MALKNMVGTLARTGAATAASVVRDPLGKATQAVGLVKGTAEAGVHLVRSHVPGAGGTVTSPPAGTESSSPSAPVATVAEPVKEAPASNKKTAQKPEEDPRDKIPGPDLAAFAPPAPEELPEPIVIVADDEAGKAF